MTARTALTFVGQVAGAFVGGPVGAAIGGMIGGTIGGNIDGPQKGPRLDDTSAPAIEFGAKVPRVYGRVWCTLSPLWWSGLRESTANSGGKGAADQTTDNYVYHCDMLGRLADGANVVAWTRIRIDGKIEGTQLASSSTASLTATARTDRWGDVQLFTGGPTQTPWSVMEAAEGVGNVSAYRDQCTFGFTNLLMPNGRNPSLIEVEVVTKTTHSIADAPELLWDAGAPVVSASPYGDASYVVYLDSGYGRNVEARTVINDVIDVSGLISAVDGDNGSPNWIKGTSDTTALAWNNLSGSGVYLHTDITRFFELGGVQGANRNAFAIRGDMLLLSGTGGFSDKTIYHFTISTGLLVAQSGVIGSVGATSIAIGSGVIYASDGGTVYELDPATMSVTDSYAVPAVAASSAQLVTNETGRMWMIRGSYMHERVAGAWVQLTASLPSQIALGNSLEAPPQIVGTTIYNNHSGKTASLWLDVITPIAEDLQTVLEAEMLRCAPLTSTHLDMSAAAGKQVYGFKASRSAAAECGVLLDWYYLDIFCGDKITVVPRGGAVEQTIPYGYTGSSTSGSGEPFAGLIRGADVESQFATSVQYINILADGEVDTQQGQRVGTGSEVRSVNFSIYSKPTEAKGRADTITYDTRVAAHTATIHLGAKQAARIQPASVLTLVDNKGNSYRTRVLRLVWNRGVYDVDICLDDPNILSTVGITTEVDTSVIEVAPAAVAEFLPLDIPRVSDAQNAPGYLALVKTNDATAARWFDSPDNVTYSAEFDFAHDAVFGTVTAASGSFGQGVLFDEGSSLTVNIGAGTLASATRAALLADRGLNLFAVGLAGRMVLGQFRTVTLVSAGVYTLGGFVNMGAKGTEQYCASIAAGDHFAMLGIAGTAQIPRGLTDLGVPFYVKAVAFGASLDNVTAVGFTANCVNLKPLSPVALRVFRDVASGAIEVDWTRRTRMDTRFGGPLGDSCPLGEATESYDVVLHNGDTVLASDTVTEPRWSVSGRVVLPAYAGGNFTTQCGSEYVALTDAYPLATNVAINRYASDGTFLWGINLGGQAVGLATNGTEAYVATIDGSNPALLRRISAALIPGPSSGNILATYTSTIGNLRGVAFDGTYVWASEFYSSNLLKLDATTLVVANTYAISSAALGAIAADGAGSIWMCSAGSPNQLIQWSIGGAAEVQRVACASQANGLLIAHGLLFVAEAAGIVVRDATTGAMINGTEGVGASYRPNLAHLSDGTVVACDRAASQLIYLDDTTGAEVLRVDVPNLWEVAGGVDDKVFAAVRGSGSTMLSKVFGPLPDPTGYSLTVYQNSAVVGRGYPATLEIA